MTLRWKRLGQGLGGLGALLVAPYLSGAAILTALGISLDQLRYHLAWSYWRALELPAYAPYATSIRWAGWLGFALAPSAWIFYVLRAWLGDRQHHPAKTTPPFDRISAIRGIWARASPSHLPGDTSWLIVAPDHATGAAALAPLLRDRAEPMAIVDLDGALYGMAREWRRAHGPVHRLAPLGGGEPWNPFAHLCHRNGVVKDAVCSVVMRLYPTDEYDVFVPSLVENAFLALIAVSNDLICADGDSAVPAPGDIAQLSQLPLTRATINSLARLPAIRGQAREALHAWLSVDDDTLAVIEKRLRGPLTLFLDPLVDRQTRGALRDLNGTVFLHVPYGRRANIAPLSELLRSQLRHERLQVVHGLDLFASLTLMERCVATSVSLWHLHAMVSSAIDTFAQQFGLLTWLGPGRGRDIDQEIAAMSAHLLARGAPGKRLLGDDTRGALRALRRRQQIVLAPGLSRPVRCKPVFAHHPTRPSPEADQGEPMAIPKSIAALLASFCAPAAAADTGSATLTVQRLAQETPVASQAIPTSVVSLGRHKFRLPMNLFEGQNGSNPRGLAFDLAWPWPGLRPLPMGVNYHDDMTLFVSTVVASIDHVDKIDDDDYAMLLQKQIQPRSENPKLRADPRTNLHMRIKGGPVFGLTPYYVDFDRLAKYVHDLYGPDSPAGDPESSMNEDWYIRFDENGKPLTLISCTSTQIPNGTRIENGHIVDTPVNGRRAICGHMFLIPEYKVWVNVRYQRVMMYDWKRVEDLVIETLRRAQVAQ